MADEFFILFKDGAPKDWARAADALAQAGALDRPEAAKACRRGCGWIGVAMPGEKARAGAAALKSAGIQACAIACAEVSIPPPAQNVTMAFCEPDALRYQLDQREAPLLLPWNSVQIISAEYLVPAKRNATDAISTTVLQMKKFDTQQQAQRIAAVGSTVRMGPIVGAIESINPKNVPPLAETTVKTALACIDLIGGDPLVRIRLLQRGFSYQCLGERMQATQRGNFRLLLNDLLARLPSAFRLGPVDATARGANLEQQENVRDESDVDLEISAILTRRSVNWDA